MRSPIDRLAWLRSGLFWRTFFLLGLLTALSMAAWVGMISVVQRGPQAQQIAAQVISVVTITQAALTHSRPELRSELLFDLVSNEGIRVFTLEPEDQIEPAPDNWLMPEIEQLVKAKLGADTRFSARVNGVALPAGGAKRVLLNDVPGESSVWAFAMMSSVDVVVGSQRSDARMAPVFLPFRKL